MPIFRTMMLTAAALPILGGVVIAAQDRYTLRIPNGPAFSDFRGYENWQVVAVSQTDDQIKAILANPAMIAGYRAGVPGNGKHFPDGSKIAKLEWSFKKNPEAPYAVTVPDTLKELAFIEKDSKRFADSGGWGYAPFKYDAVAGTFEPDAKDAKCGFACHTAVAAKDYMFTAYPKR